MIDTLKVHFSGYRSPEACERELTYFLSGATYAERLELQAAGTPQHTIDALYPLNFQSLASIASSRFVHDGFILQGGEHLNNTMISQDEWMKNIANVKHVRAAFSESQRKLYEAAWAATYPGYGTVVGELARFLHSILSRYWQPSMADDLAGWHIRSLFMAYWLLANPSIAATNVYTRAAMDDIVVWVADQLLADGKQDGAA